MQQNPDTKSKQQNEDNKIQTLDIVIFTIVIFKKYCICKEIEKCD